MIKRIKKIIITTLLILVAALMVYPMVVTFLNSFMPEWEVAQYKDNLIPDKSIKLIPSEVTLEQYAKVVFGNGEYWVYFWNSILLTIPIVIGQIFVSAFAAYAFCTMQSRFKEWLFFAYIVVMLLPFQVTLVPAYITADALGLIDNRLSVILPGIFSTFGVFLLRQHMSQLPQSYFNAAKLDGAGHFRTFWYVILPMCKTGIAALAILSFVDQWNMVEQPLIFLNSTAKYPLSVYFYNINQESVTLAFAASVIYMIPIVLLFLNGEQHLREGIRFSEYR